MKCSRVVIVSFLSTVVFTFQVAQGAGGNKVPATAMIVFKEMQPLHTSSTRPSVDTRNVNRLEDSGKSKMMALLTAATTVMVVNPNGVAFPTCSVERHANTRAFVTKGAPSKMPSEKRAHPRYNFGKGKKGNSVNHQRGGGQQRNTGKRK